MSNKNLFRIFVIFILLANCISVKAQPGATIELPKPKKFENRQLPAEKTGNKKFTIPRRFMQNTTTHYNFYFNANEKIKDVLERAKAEHKDDYSKLLSFYNYSFESTSRYKTELDSVIYKSTAGILLHDLRSNWVDNMYLLMGKSYFFKKDFDSAYITFQYLNYAFSPKEKDGYDKVIGSNSNEGGNAFSISTNEKSNIVKKTLSRPPSRNESLVWLVKTYIAKDALPEAAGLLQTLKHDPLFPSRLQTDLDEAEAWYFYKQNAYDSAALYLDAALPNASNKQEMARWEYLIAQLYAKIGRHEDAKEYYDRVLHHTIDPVMEVYALLNGIRQNSTDEKGIQDAVDALAKMGRRDKYLNYHDIIFYTAAEIELERYRPDAAKMFLQKSIKESVNNNSQKSKSFLSLANIELAQKDYINAKNHYDSVDIKIIPNEELDAFKNKKIALTVIAQQETIIHRQDSLQKLAAMPPAERDAVLKKLLKQLRKQQGLKEEDVNFGNSNGPLVSNKNAAPDLFNTNDAKAEWYFANPTLKTSGFNDFKSKWGNRPNVDNWQRSAVIKQQSQGGKNGQNPDQNPDEATAAEPVKKLSIDVLAANIPLTAEKMKISNDSILHAKFELGKGLQDGLENYLGAIDVYENLLQQFPHSPVEEQTLFNLYYCYKKTGNEQKMLEIKKAMETGFANNKLTAIVKDPQAADSLHQKDGAALYDNIYNLFIEGKFEEAIQKKHNADSLYGKYFWNPQLLYIEAVYHIQQRDDSSAKVVLNHIQTLYPSTPMAAKAKKLMEVLGRRKEIERYLTNLQLKMPVEDSTQAVAAAPKTMAPATVTPLNKPQIIPKKSTDSLINHPLKDSIAIAKKPAIVNNSMFSYAPEKIHLVALVMDKVDPVYVNEAKNAFARYHKEVYYNKQIEINPMALTDDIRLIVFSKFDNAAVALDYVSKAKKLAPSELIPWMPAAKYSFIIITESNLELLKNNKDIAAYKKFLLQNFPGSF